MNFGTVIPDVQLRASKLGASGGVEGLVIATYSISQFIFAPILGRLSDIVGRRRVLLITSSMAILASLLYAFSHSLGVMFASRAVLGVAGANLGVAYAYIADVTGPEKRAAAMGKIGMAFGLGFMFGPPLGAAMVQLGHGDPFLLGMVSAFFGLANFLFIYWILPEAPGHPKEEDEFRAMNPLAKLWRALNTPGLGFLLVLFLVANLAFSNLESTFFRLAHDDFHIDEFKTSLVLVLVGVVAAIMQGGLIPRLVPRFGEVNLLRVSYFVQSPALAIVPYCPPILPLIGACILLGVGSGLAQPNLSSLISKAAPAAMVGGIFGVTQSLGAIARILGPIMGNSLYEFGHSIPYVLAAVIMIVPLGMAQFVRKPEPQSA